MFSADWIDELGNRLRQGITAEDRELYSDFEDSLDQIRFALEAELLELAPGAEVGSRTKRVETAAAKLQRRPELSLSQVTDLAGCRIIVSSRAEQNAIVARLLTIYEVIDLDDKSDDPKSGYRAVHLDIRYRGRPMEIQVQTTNQHRWQQVSEEAAGYDISIKYGGGHPIVRQALLELSELAWRCDLENTDLPDANIEDALNVILLAHAG